MHRLVIATPLYPPEIGGPATYAALLVAGLPAKGVEVELVRFSSVRHLPKLLRHYAYYRRVLAAARKADLVLALDPVSVGLPGVWAAKRAGKPLVVKIVGDYAWEQGRQRFGVVQGLDEFVHTKQRSWRVRLLQRIQTRVAKSAARIIVPSEYLKGIVAAWGIPAEKVEVIYNAVPVEELGTVPAAVTALPRPLVVTAGRLVSWKRIEGVIDALASLHAGLEGHLVSLIVVGEGLERAALEERATAMLPGRHAFTGALSHADTLATLASADLFVLNSSYEGLSHLLIEALALGVPTIATSVGGNPEVVTDGETGLVIPAGDHAALVHALRTLLGNAPLRLRLSVNAKVAAQRFSSETMLERTAALLESI